MKNVIQSFSYPITDAAIVTQAEDRAKELGLSFSKYILRLVKQDLQRETEVSILAARQTTISEYDIKLFESPRDRYKKISSLNKEQQTKLAIDVNQLRNQIQALRR